MSAGTSEKIRGQAEARLHKRLAEAHDAYAHELSGIFGQADVAEGPKLRGSVQRRIVGLAGMFTERGMSAGEVAGELDYDEANSYGVLKSLTESGIAEEVEGSSPKRWRMEVKHRRDRILRLSRLIPEGRWTTYGEFSIAVYDSVKMAITVGRVAARNPAFAAPHHVLWSGGEIPDGWEDDEGQGPEECERRLEAEGIKVKDRHAERKKMLGWEELKDLLQADEETSDEEPA